MIDTLALLEKVAYLLNCDSNAFPPNSNQLKEQLTELRQKLAEKDRDSNAQFSSHEKEIAQFKVKIKSLEDDREKALREKDRLLDEVTFFTGSSWFIDMHHSKVVWRDLH